MSTPSIQRGRADLENKNHAPEYDDVSDKHLKGKEGRTDGKKKDITFLDGTNPKK